MPKEKTLKDFLKKVPSTEECKRMVANAMRSGLISQKPVLQDVTPIGEKINKVTSPPPKEPTVSPEEIVTLPKLEAVEGRVAFPVHGTETSRAPRTYRCRHCGHAKSSPAGECSRCGKKASFNRMKPIETVQWTEVEKETWASFIAQFKCRGTGSGNNIMIHVLSESNEPIGKADYNMVPPTYYINEFFKPKARVCTP